MVERAILDPDGRRRVAPWAHGDIPGRDEPDQHAVGAITGLDAWLAERLREGDNITLAVNDDGSITINSSAVGGGGGGGASAINDLTDVDTATDPPAVDDVLAWDGSLWTPAGLTAADTGAIPETLIDAKGDLLVGTAADTAARLAVGADGQVLTADSGEASGVKWAAAGGDSGYSRSFLLGGM